jgi:hypothetical protein
MGVLFINLDREYNFQSRFHASAEQDELGKQEGRKKRFLLSCFPYLFFGGGSFCLEKKIFRVELRRSLKQRKKFSANIAVKCQGTRCESGTVAPL